MSAKEPWWICSSCGFRNRPRHVANSLGLVGGEHPLHDPEWRHSHCEQCGKAEDDTDVTYTPS
jgi:hypothetical protein